MALPGSSEYFFARSAKLPPAFSCLRTSSAFLRASSTPFGVDFPVGTRQRSLDQNVAYVDLLGQAILVTMLIVVGLQVFARHVDAGFDLRGIQHDILDLAFLRNRVVVGRLVALVEGLQLSVGRLDLFHQVIFAEDGVLELDLGVLLLKLPAHITIGDQRAAGDQVTKLVQQNLVLQTLLELGHAQVSVLQKVLVLLLPHEFAARKEGGRIAPVLQLVPHFVIRDPKAQPFGFRHQGLATDQVLGGALGKVRKQHRGLFAAAGKLLAQHLPRLALHFKCGHLLAGHFGHDPLAGTAQADTVADAARNQCDRHGGTNNRQQSAKNHFLDRARGLQKSNHCLVTPKFDGGKHGL